MTSFAKQTLVLVDNGQATSPIGSDQQECATSPYLTVEQAADYLRVSKNYLDKLRVSGNGPDFVRLGRRKVLYRKADLDRWVEKRIYASTSQYGID